MGPESRLASEARRLLLAPGRCRTFPGPPASRWLLPLGPMRLMRAQRQIHTDQLRLEGKVILIRRIDRGGFGYVDEVQLPNGTRAARKTFDAVVPDPNAGAGLRRRFEREVRIQSALRHPNIMPVLEAGLGDDPPWFSMPLAAVSLEQKLASDHASRTFDPTPWPDILAAVEELHRLGYVHRDLKPANVLLVDATWMVSDFGLILPTMRDTTVLTGSHSAYGSRNYAAPEQAADFRNTPEQADIYALGCMLHDAIDPAPMRIPYAQVRTTGPYGPLLEKCTEVDYRRRFPTVAALRAALYDIWSAGSATTAPLSDQNLFDELTRSPDSVDIWRRFILHLEQSEQERASMLRSVNSDLILRLAALDDVLFSRMLALVCSWASHTGFEWTYCDVVGDRLLDAYRVAPVRVRCGIVLAALELAVSHNRWHVMTQVGGMLGPTADDGLVERILIEAQLDHRIEYGLRRIERIISWPRAHWHERVGRHLNAQDSQARGGA